MPNGVLIGLYNRAMGLVREIIYDSSCDMTLRGPLGSSENKDLPTVIVVEFPEYKGKSFFPTHGAGKSKWVPITPMKLFCDVKHCCHRSGFPLVVQKAKSIHSLEGMTCGQGEVINRLVVHLDPPMEGKMPNVHYTALSRVKQREDLAISTTETITTDFFKKLGSFKTNKKQRSHVAKLERMEVGENCSPEEYEELLKCLIQQAAPRSTDSIADREYMAQVFQFNSNGLS